MSSSKLEAFLCRPNFRNRCVRFLTPRDLVLICSVSSCVDESFNYSNVVCDSVGEFWKQWTAASNFFAFGKQHVSCLRLVSDVYTHTTYDEKNRPVPAKSIPDYWHLVQFCDQIQHSCNNSLSDPVYIAFLQHMTKAYMSLSRSSDCSLSSFECSKCKVSHPWNGCERQTVSVNLKKSMVARRSME